MTNGKFIVKTQAEYIEARDLETGETVAGSYQYFPSLWIFLATCGNLNCQANP
jgi:hypothetical protein